MNALLAGFGGIGENVYYPELKKLGYEIDVLDSAGGSATYTDVSQVSKTYEIAVISTPNHTHGTIATALAKAGTKRIFIEKPGLSTPGEWIKLCETFPNTQFHLVKNNLYRSNYGDIFKLIKSEKELIGVDIHWLNGNRIPNPGSWFTNKALAFGGVSRDLMPHLYCFAYQLFGKEAINKSRFKQASYQRWKLPAITNTEYGTVNPNGVYDVDDVAMAAAVIGNVTLKMSAAWKEGYDKQSITLFFKDGTTYEWQFGLCPTEAYGLMLQDTTNTYDIDMAIHKFLEEF